MKHYNLILGVACAGIMLSGCVFPGTQKNIADTKESKTLSKELELAKFLYENQNDTKAFELFSKYAAQGNADAEAWLGRCYMNGIGTSHNVEKAFEYFSKAAAKNHPYGINGVGVCKQYGIGTDIDLRAAVDSFKKAADMGHPLAILNLASTYNDKNSGFYNVKLAEDYFKKAIAANAKSAKELYANFLISQKRYSEALSLLQRGNSYYSKITLSECYANGLGVKINIKKSLSILEEAFRLPNKNYSSEARRFYIAGCEELFINGLTDHARYCFKVGADHGDLKSIYMYACILKESKSMDAARKYMWAAADKGHDYAQYNLGLILMDDNDYDNAIKYLSMAVISPRTKIEAVNALVSVCHKIKDFNQRNHWINYGVSLGSTYCYNALATEKMSTGKNEDFAYAAALFTVSMLNEDENGQESFDEIIKNDYERLRIMADKGNGNALFVLGILGILNDKDHPNFAIGIELLEKAVKQKNKKACYWLGNIYFNGEAVKKDLKKALDYYRKGAEYGNPQCAESVVKIFIHEKEFEKTTVEEYKKAFEKCLSLSEYSVLYDYGKYMEFTVKDKKKAEELYLWAAKNGDSRAMVHLYKFYSESNPEASWVHFMNSVELNDPEALFLLGNIEKDLNRPRDAYSNFLDAFINNGSDNAKAALAECYLKGYGCEPNVSLFWKIAEKAYKNGSAPICLILGNVYQEGKICPRDLKKAKEYYTEGVKRGNEKCKKALEAMK